MTHVNVTSGDGFCTRCGLQRSAPQFEGKRHQHSHELKGPTPSDLEEKQLKSKHNLKRKLDIFHSTYLDFGEFKALQSFPEEASLGVREGRLC